VQNVTAAPVLPLSLQTDDGYFRIECIDQVESYGRKRQIIRVTLRDHRGAGSDYLLATGFLLAIADAVYRTCGQQPRDQPIRIEVALAPSSPAAAAVPVLQLVPPADDEVAVIKRRMLEGK
jgi:hypothetical protein